MVIAMTIMMILTASSCFTLVMASWGARPSLKFIMSRGPLWYLTIIIIIIIIIVIINIIIVIAIFVIAKTYFPDLSASFVKSAAWSSGLPEHKPREIGDQVIRPVPT